MLNKNPINSQNINYNEANNLSQKDAEAITSFTSSQKTKYAVKTRLGQYFNFGNFSVFSSGVCGVGDRIRYGNILIDTDIENLSEKEIQTANNPILDGGIIQNTRFSQKELEFTIKIISNDKKGFEKEIRNIKRTFNLKGTKILKKEHDRISEINVELQDVEVERYSQKGTQVTIYFISLDPNFKKPLGNTKAYRNINGNLDVSLVINDTDVEPFLHTLIDIKQLTGTITEVKLEINGYKLEIGCNITTPDVVIFDGKNIKVFVGNTEITDFKGKFIPFEINEPKNVKCEFVGGTADLYSIYFSYDNIYL